MSQAPSERPKFVRSGDMPAGQVQEFAPKPSADNARLIRQVTAVAAAVCVIGLVARVAFGVPEGLLPIFAVFIAWGVVSRVASREDDLKAGYAVRYAWFGERAKPARLIEKKRVDDLRARAADEKAQAALPGWIRAGLPAGRAPRPDYEMRRIDIRRTVDLSGDDLDIVDTVTGLEPMVMSVGLVGGKLPREQWVAVGDLVSRGILRRTAASVPSKWWSKYAGPGNAELVPELVPLVGVVRFAKHGLLAQWREGGLDRQIQCLAVPGHVVQVEQIAGDDSGHDLTFRLALRDADEIVDGILAACSGLDEPAAGEAPPVVHLHRLGDDDRMWWVRPHATGFGVERYFPEEEPERQMSGAELRDWLHGLLAG